MGLFGIKNGKSELASVRFDSAKFTPEQAKAWLTKNKLTATEFVVSKQEAEVFNTKIPQYVNLEYKFPNGKPEVTQEELDGGYRNVKLYAMKPDTYHGLPYSAEFLEQYAESWINQPGNRIGFFKMNHGNDVTKRAGPIEKSYWDEKEQCVIHEGKITKKKYFEDWDAGTLTTNSVEFFVEVGVDPTDPEKIIPVSMQGTDNAFVEHPHCKTCGTEQMQRVREFVQNHQDLYVNLEETDVELVFNEDISESQTEGNTMEEEDKSMLLKLLEKLGYKPNELIENESDTGGNENMTEDLVAKLKEQLSKDPEKLEFTDDEVKELEKLSKDDITVKALLEMSKLTVEEEEEDESGEEEEETLESGESTETTEGEEETEENEETEEMITMKKAELETMIDDKFKSLQDEITELKSKDATRETHKLESDKAKVIDEILGYTKLMNVKEVTKASLEDSVKEMKLEDETPDFEKQLASLEAQKAGYKAAAQKLHKGDVPNTSETQFQFEEEEEEDEELTKLESKMSGGLYKGKSITIKD